MIIGGVVRDHGFIFCNGSFKSVFADDSCSFVCVCMCDKQLRLITHLGQYDIN